MNTSLWKWSFLITLSLFAAFYRLTPHPSNFTPLLAMGIFAGALLQSERKGALLVLGAMFLSDLSLGFHPLAPLVYFCFGFSALIGKWISLEAKILHWVSAALVSSFFFYLVTNAGHWMIDLTYTRSLRGLLDCYIAALPFFRNSILGDLFFTGLIFGLAQNLGQLKLMRDLKSTAQ